MYCYVWMLCTRWYEFIIISYMSIFIDIYMSGVAIPVHGWSFWRFTGFFLHIKFLPNFCIFLLLLNCYTNTSVMINHRKGEQYRWVMISIYYSDNEIFVFYHALFKSDSRGNLCYVSSSAWYLSLKIPSWKMFIHLNRQCFYTMVSKVILTHVCRRFQAFPFPDSSTIQQIYHWFRQSTQLWSPYGNKVHNTSEVLWYKYVSSYLYM